MPSIASPEDGARLFYRDYRPVTSPIPFHPSEPSNLQTRRVALVFIHGWPMSSRMFTHLMLPLCESYRYRCIAPDRRGFGQSEWCGNASIDAPSYETFARDTIAILKAAQPPIDEFILVGSSMGCGESLLVWTTSEWVQARCKGMIWIGMSLPCPQDMFLKTPSISQEAWDAISVELRNNRRACAYNNIPGVMGSGPAGASDTLDDNILQHYVDIIGDADELAIERTSMIHNYRDFRPELTALAKSDKNLKVLILHGGSDQGMPLEATARVVQEMLGKMATLKVYEKAAHGLYLTHKHQILDDIVEFGKGLGY